jgi:hypothetical protein
VSIKDGLGIVPIERKTRDELRAIYEPARPGVTTRIFWFAVGWSFALLLCGCATAPAPLVDLRVLDLNGCLLDVEQRADGTLHETSVCEAVTVTALSVK